MNRALSILGTIWRGTRYLWLVMLSALLGALLTQPAGYGIAWLTGDAKWIVHVRCAGWTLGALAAAVLAIGAPSVLERFWHTRIRRERSGSHDSRTGEDAGGTTEDSGNLNVVRGIRAVPAAFLIGSFAGLVVGAMLSGMWVAVCFFLALSPLARDGWWPILPWQAQGTGDGFVADWKGTPCGYIFLVILGATMLLMIVGALAGSVSSRRTRYEVFRRKAGK